MRVRLDPEAKTLDGRQRIVWRNPAPEPVGELWFHLYLNAFKNSKSTFFAESDGQLRGDRMRGDGWGRVEVTGKRSERRENPDGTSTPPAPAPVAPEPPQPVAEPGPPPA